MPKEHITIEALTKQVWELIDRNEQLMTANEYLEFLEKLSEDALERAEDIEPEEEEEEEKDKDEENG